MKQYPKTLLCYKTVENATSVPHNVACKHQLFHVYMWLAAHYALRDFARDGQLEGHSSRGLKQGDEPANEGQKVYEQEEQYGETFHVVEVWEWAKMYNTSHTNHKHDVEQIDRAEKQNGLQRVEAHEAIAETKDQAQNAREPAEDIAERGSNFASIKWRWLRIGLPLRKLDEYLYRLLPVWLICLLFLSYIPRIIAEVFRLFIEMRRLPRCSGITCIVSIASILMA